MKEYVQSLPGGLDAPITEDGGNLSVSSYILQELWRKWISFYIPSGLGFSIIAHLNLRFAT